MANHTRISVIMTKILLNKLNKSIMTAVYLMFLNYRQIVKTQKWPP